MNKEDFITRVLNSTDGIAKITPDDSLYDRIQARIEDERPANSRTKWLVAAAIAVLISLNIGVLSNTSQKAANDNLSELVAIPNNQLY